jgi:hypothetical protein
MSALAGIRSNLNSILGLRDSLDVALKPVHIVTRTWSGPELGHGTKTEARVRVLPSPRVFEFKNDVRLVEGGTIQQGDILLKMISKQSYPTQNLVDCSVTAENIEKFYEVGGILYRVVAVTEKHLTWSVLLRRLSQQAR